MNNDYKIENDKYSWFILILGYIMLGYLYNIIELKPITIEFVFKGIGSVIGIYLLYLRFKTTDDIKKNQEEQFHLNNQYKNFLETSKLLTDKDSTIEAKISAMYLLYDYAKNYPQDTEKVYQLLSEYIKPLLKCIDNNCSSRSHIKVKESFEIEKLSKKIIYKYEKLKTLQLDIANDNLVERINKWQINGNSTEKEISIALIIIRDLTTNILPNVNEHIELSNIIIFNLNIDFIADKSKIKFKSKIRPTYNLIFLECNLKGIDFSKSKFYYCKFINCYLKDSNFKECELVGTEFINCDLEKSNFQDIQENAYPNFKDCTNEPNNEKL